MTNTPDAPRRTTQDRLAREESLAVGTVLFRAHDALRSVENTLELEAADPRVAQLHQQAKRLRKAAAATLVEVAATAVEEVVPGS